MDRRPDLKYQRSIDLTHPALPAHFCFSLWSLSFDDRFQLVFSLRQWRDHRSEIRTYTKHHNTRPITFRDCQTQDQPHRRLGIPLEIGPWSFSCIKTDRSPAAVVVGFYSRAIDAPPETPSQGREGPPASPSESSELHCSLVQPLRVLGSITSRYCTDQQS